MITNWAEVVRLNRLWTLDQRLFDEVISALDAAICQVDVELTLLQPIFAISPRPQSPIVKDVAAHQTLMLGYQLTELPKRADVVIVS